MTPQKDQPSLPGPKRLGFVDDFKRFFLRGLATILPTLVTLWLLIWVWDFLWDNIGRSVINFIRIGWYDAGARDWLPFQTKHYIRWQLDDNDFGNLIGLAFWRVAERSLMRIPLVRAIYPAVKQVTDFVLADRTHQFQGSRVVAVQPHEQNIWSIGLITSARQWTLDAGPEEMMTVFIPSSPTSFSGYVLVVPRSKVIELPMTVEEALRLLVTGGLIMPGEGKTDGKDIASQVDVSAQPAVRIAVDPIPSPRPLEKIG